MSFKTQIEAINNLVSIAEIGTNANRNNGPYQSFGIGENSITFQGFENYTIFQNEILKIFKLNKNIAETYSLKSFKKKAIQLIITLSKEGRKAIQSDIETLYNDILAIKLSNYEVFNELFGANLRSTKIDFGDFTVYNIELSKQELLSKYPLLNVHEDLYFNNTKSNLLIGVNVEAREYDKAIEIADSYLKSFENVISYVIADLSHNRTIGLFNFLGHRTRDALICSSDNISTHGNTLSMVFEFDLENDYLKNKEVGNDIIWGLITKPNKSEIEKRILNSVEWIGKGVSEKDSPKSLFQFVIAIEGMLQLSEKSFITPSIVSQLSDWLAFILEDEADKRRNIARYFKDIYQKRSAIAHGGLKDIEKKDLQLALTISKLMIISFLTKAPFNSFSSIEQLNSYINELKFK